MATMTDFNLQLYHNMVQFYKLAKSQNHKIDSGILRTQFDLTERESIYYWFMIKNNLSNVYPDKTIRNVLIIPDLHLPFIREGFLRFCIQQYHHYHCNHVIFLGDVLDNHYASRYATDPDGLSAKDELDLAIELTIPWYQAFPEADVCIGNHDIRPQQKAFESGISQAWLKDFKDVLQTPGWNWADYHEIDDVYYTHGLGGGARTGCWNRMLNRRQSVVQGHFHTEAYIRWNVSHKDRLFAFQVGCGINDKSYAAAYAKHNIAKFVIGCGVVLNDGTLPIFIPMPLENF